MLCLPYESFAFSLYERALYGEWKEGHLFPPKYSGISYDRYSLPERHGRRY